MRSNSVTTMVPKHVDSKRGRAIDTGGFLFDEALTRAALALAGSTVTTRDQATKLFREFAKGRPEPAVITREVIATGRLPDRSRTPGPSEELVGEYFFGAGASFSTRDWQDAQNWLREWLPKIAAADTLAESSASALARELAKDLSRVSTALRVGRRRGNFELTVYTLRDSIAAASMRAVLPFLFQWGWKRRLGRCQLKECGEWFLQESRTGPPRQYCGTEHANLARVRRFRQRHV
jgi:hypothetical protein